MEQTLAHVVAVITDELEERRRQVQDNLLTMTPVGPNFPISYARGQAELQLLSELKRRVPEIVDALINNQSTTKE